MSMKELSRVLPLIRTLSRNKINNQFIHQFRCSSSFVLPRNQCIYNVQGQNVSALPARWNSIAYLHLIGSRSHTRYYSQQKPDLQKDSSNKETSSKEDDQTNPPTDSKSPDTQKLSLFQRIKVMYRDYWYILGPVHLVTSAFWFGSFYYLAKSGVDIVALMKTLGFSETITQKLEQGHSTSAYLALAYALYKVATPLRYTVTLGGTTYSINKLKELGYIKPIPPNKELVAMYEEKKEQFKEKSDQLKERIQDNKELIRERYQDNKAILQEKYSAEKCKISLRNKTDKILTRWRRAQQKPNGASKQNGNGGVKTNGKRKNGTSSNENSTKER